MRARRLLVAALVLVALAVSADAAVAWRTQSTITLSVGAPLAQFAQGAGATRSHFVSGFALSSNATSFSATIQGRAGGAVVVNDMVEIVSHSGASRTVTLRATQVTNAQVSTLSWTVRNGTTTVATLDARQASPSVTFALPAGATYLVDLRVTILPGAGHNNADVPLALGLSVR